MTPQMTTKTLIFRDRAFLRAMTWALLQQTLVATGTFFLAKLVKQAAGEIAQVSPLTACAFFVAVLLPGTWIHFRMSVALAEAKNSVMERFYESHRRAFHGRIDVWRDSVVKSQSHETMMRAGPEVIQGFLHFAVDAFATVCNVVFNSVAVLASTDSRLGLALAVAACLGIVIARRSSLAIEDSAREEVEATARLSGVLARSWDNVLLGFRPAHERWAKKFNDGLTASAEASRRSVLVRERAIAWSGAATNAVVVGAALGICFSRGMDRSAVAALVAMLPRSLQIVMHAQIVQRFSAQWKAFQEKLRILDKVLQEPAKGDLSRWVRNEKIRLNGKSLSTDRVVAFKPGRYLLTGENGAGKSTYLQLLKQEMGASATYVPAHSDLEMPDANGGSGGGERFSSGERAMHRLREVFRDEGSDAPTVLLLDEWDANLSNENAKVIDEWISKHSASRVIIEARHVRVG